MPKKQDPIARSIDRRLTALCVPEDLAARVVARAHEQKKRRPQTVRFRRPLAIAAVFCLIVTCSMGVLAATTPHSRNLLAVLGEQVFFLLQPVERSCVQNGIETTVVAAMNDRDTVDIYVAVRDLEGSRVNARTDLADVSLSGPLISPSVQLVQFDEKSATATFRIEGVCGEDLNGKKVTLSIGTVLLNRSDYFSQDTGVNVAQIARAFPEPEFQELTGSRVYMTVGSDNETPLFADDKALAPAESEENALTQLLPWGSLAAGGVADGALYLLVCPDETGRYAQYTDVRLLDKRHPEQTGQTIHTVEFGALETIADNQYYEYTEYVIPLPENAGSEALSIVCSGVTYEEALRGKWSSTFRLESVSRQRVAYPDLTVNGRRISRVELSPMGVCVVMEGDGNDPDTARPKIVAYDAAGQPIPVNGSSSSWNGTESTLKNQFETPLPLEEISRVTVDGKEIEFKN